MGVWIETSTNTGKAAITKVTPCVGVWIETVAFDQLLCNVNCHTLRGCVD